MTRINAPHLIWNESGEPYSTTHDDIYFSPESGIDETRYVFIQHNQLPERFSTLQKDQSFVIGETGFGTGLNFLATWQTFDQYAPKGATLHFISVEYAPLTQEELIKTLAIWEELSLYRDQLTHQYHAVHEGYQRLIFDGGRIVLTLLIGDVHTMLPELNAQIDAWFLDGFAPAKNPDMWNVALFQQLARLSHPNTTIATFTSAGFVRRGLIAEGFNMKKAKGFGHKREMIHGQFRGLMGPFSRYQLPRYPNWFKRRAYRNQQIESPYFRPYKTSITDSEPPKSTVKSTAIIIGAGIAGCSTAYSLARRGWKVTILEKHSSIAQEGSGNPQGILYLKLSAHRTDQTRLLIEGFGYTLRLLAHLTDQGLLEKGEDWDNCGVLQLAYDEKKQARQNKIAKHFSSSLLKKVSQADASKIANVSVESEGLYFPESGWLKPHRLCEALLEHPNITLNTQFEVTDLYSDIDENWTVSSAETTLSANIVILANATAAKEFEQTKALPLRNIRGQTTFLSETLKSQNLQTVLCSHGYISPSRDGKHCIGASFNFDNDDLTLDPQDHADNIDMLKEASTQLFNDLELEDLNPDQLSHLDGRAAYRSTANDKMPLIGPIAFYKPFLERYEMITKDARAIPDEDCPWIPNLYLNSAHGSRGMITAPIAGEQLSAMINDEPYLIEQSLVEACHPNRCWYRKLRYPNEA